MHKLTNYFAGSFLCLGLKAVPRFRAVVSLPVFAKYQKGFDMICTK